MYMYRREAHFTISLSFIYIASLNGELEKLYHVEW